MEARPNLYLY